MVEATNLSRMDILTDSGMIRRITEGMAAPKMLNSNEWLARELHDGLLQNLLYLDLELTSLASWKTDESQDFDHRVEAMHQVVRVGIEELRDALGMLRSQTPARNGQGARISHESLQEGLAKLVESFNAKFGERVRLGVQNADWPAVVPSFIGHQVHAIVHEAVSNALRHSNALEVSVQLRNQCRGIAVTIADNGCGFDLSSTRNGHYGLRIMKERADAIGATIRVASAPGKGTKVRLHIPQVLLNAKIA